MTTNFLRMKYRNDCKDGSGLQLIVYLLPILRVRSFGVNRIRISDPRSLGSWCIKETDESALVTDSSVPLMHRDPSDLGSLIVIQIIPKERTLTSPLSVASF